MSKTTYYNGVGYTRIPRSASGDNIEYYIGMYFNNVIKSAWSVEEPISVGPYREDLTYMDPRTPDEVANFPILDDVYPMEGRDTYKQISIYENKYHRWPQPIVEAAYIIWSEESNLTDILYGLRKCPLNMLFIDNRVDNLEHLVSPIPNFITLRYMRIDAFQGNSINILTDETVDSIGRLSSLRDLRLANCTVLRPDRLADALAKMTNLHRLQLRGVQMQRYDEMTYTYIRSDGKYKILEIWDWAISDNVFQNMPDNLDVLEANISMRQMHFIWNKNIKTLSIGRWGLNSENYPEGYAILPPSVKYLDPGPTTERDIKRIGTIHPSIKFVNHWYSAE